MSCFSLSEPICFLNLVLLTYFLEPTDPFFLLRSPALQLRLDIELQEDSTTFQVAESPLINPQKLLKVQKYQQDFLEEARIVSHLLLLLPFLSIIVFQQIILLAVNVAEM